MKKILFYILFFTTVCLAQTMPSVDTGNIQQAVSSSGGTSGTISSFVVPSGTNKCILVGVAIRGDQYVTGITFNTSENFVKVDSDKYSTGTGSLTIELWKLVNPTSTTANIVVTYNANLTFTSGIGAVSLTDVDQTTTIGASYKPGLQVTTTPSANITTTTANSLVMDFLAIRQTSATFTSDYTTVFGGGAGVAAIAGGSQSAATATTYTMSGTVSGTYVIMTIVVEVLGSSAGASGWSGIINGVTPTSINGKAVSGISKVIGK